MGLPTPAATPHPSIGSCFHVLFLDGPFAPGSLPTRARTRVCTPRPQTTGRPSPGGWKAPGDAHPAAHPLQVRTPPEGGSHHCEPAASEGGRADCRATRPSQTHPRCHRQLRRGRESGIRSGTARGSGKLPTLTSCRAVRRSRGYLRSARPTQAHVVAAKCRVGPRCWAGGSP